MDDSSMELKKERFPFIMLVRRFVGPYKGCVVLNVLCNLLSTVFSLFSFALLIPILEILFKTNNTVYEYMPFLGIRLSSRITLIAGSPITSWRMAR